jgi:hypothetical protein
METRGFQFNAPSAARLEGIQAPSFGFASGASLVADPGIDLWMKGQQQATENLLSGISVGIKGITEGISDRVKLNEETKQLKLKREQELEDSNKEFLRDVYIAGIKESTDSKKLADELKRLEIAEKRRSAAIASGNWDFDTPLPETSTEQPLAEEDGSSFSLRSGEGFSAGLSDVAPPSETPQDLVALPVETPKGGAGQPTGRYIEQDLGSGRTGLLDRATGKIVPGTIAIKEETSSEPTPEGFTKEGFTRKTPTGTETYKRQGAGKELTSEMVTKLSQFDSVKMTLDEIKTTMAGIDRGPITGMLRERNPYDVDAQTLNKLVESVVPGLARTVFGEVGVLTDADVRRYKEMVPNMKTEEQVAEALIKMLEKKIDASYKGYIGTAKKAGFDISGFEAAEAEEKKAADKTTAQSGLYNEIKALRDQVANTSLVDTNRQALIQSIAAKTKEYIQKTGQSPKF